MSEKLRIEGVSVHFEGLVALTNVDLQIASNQILGLIGPNGAGKTTLLNVVSGFVQPSQGRVFLGSRDITRLAPHRRAALGLARSFQAVRLFGELTVLENVEVGALARTKRRGEARRTAIDLLRRMDLLSASNLPARALPAGHQHRLGILRALALEPSFLLLDEPAAGLDELEGEELVTSIREIRDDIGCGVLVIDHDMRVIMPLCEQLQVLNYGETIAIGDPDSVRTNPAVLEAYLGTQQ